MLFLVTNKRSHEEARLKFFKLEYKNNNDTFYKIIKKTLLVILAKNLISQWFSIFFYFISKISIAIRIFRTHWGMLRHVSIRMPIFFCNVDWSVKNMRVEVSELAIKKLQKHKKFYNKCFLICDFLIFFCNFEVSKEDHKNNELSNYLFKKFVTNP